MWLTSGNMTQDGVYTYTYDAENRLICVAPTSPATGDVKVESVYDYMGRRIRKVVTAWDASLGTGGEWEAVPTSSTHFVYDGWNLVLELDGSATGLGGDGLPTYSNAAIRKYTWGLDLSGLSGNPSISGIHGAGGIGGLLAAEQLLNSMAFVYFYDANGNVGQAYNHTLNTLAARYEYDPYGNLVNMTGALFKGKNPFRFSTKYFDRELDLHGTNDGLYYYGYRFYSPRLGRWLTRDPIGETGGENLYQAMLNTPLSIVDPYGQSPSVPAAIALAIASGDVAWLVSLTGITVAQAEAVIAGSAALVLTGSAYVVVEQTTPQPKPVPVPIPVPHPVPLPVPPKKKPHEDRVKCNLAKIAFRKICPKEDGADPHYGCKGLNPKCPEDCGEALTRAAKITACQWARKMVIRYCPNTAADSTGRGHRTKIHDDQNAYRRCKRLIKKCVEHEARKARQENLRARWEALRQS